MKRVGVIARFSLLELLRRKDLAVLGLFAGISIVFLGLARVVGFETPSAATFTLNLALTLVTGLAHLMTLLMAARQLPDELERRTLFLLLARPVTRAEIFLGKSLAAWGTGLVLYFSLLLPVLILVPRLEPFEAGTFWQMLALIPPGLAITAALGMCLSLLVPKNMAIAFGAALLFGANTLGSWRGVGTLLHFLPVPSKLDLTLRYTDGALPLSGSAMALSVAYALIWSILLLGFSMKLFSRRPLS